LQNQVYFSAFNWVLKGFLKKTLYFYSIFCFKNLIKPSLSLLPDLAHLSGRAHLPAPAYLVEPDEVASASPTGRTPLARSRPLPRARSGDCIASPSPRSILTSSVGIRR
jgi:hypothetical protein